MFRIKHKENKFQWKKIIKKCPPQHYRNFQTKKNKQTNKNKLLCIRILLFPPDDKYVEAKNTENSIFLTFLWHNQQRYRSLRFDNGDANEVVAEKQTSRPLKLLRPSTKTLIYLKVAI